MAQTQKTRTSAKRETETPVEVRSSTKRDELLEDIDAMLEDIEEVLEENQAEEQTSGCECYPEGPIPPWCAHNPANWDD